MVGAALNAVSLCYRNRQAGLFREMAEKVEQSRYRGTVYGLNPGDFEDFKRIFEPNVVMTDVPWKQQALMLCLAADILESP
jgi:hypothetical protein